jgi:hypothetical protein
LTQSIQDCKRETRLADPCCTGECEKVHIFPEQALFDSGNILIPPD